MRHHNAHLIHVTNSGCDVSHTLAVDYVLLITNSAQNEARYAETVNSIRPLFDHVIVTQPIGAKGYQYADHYLKLMLLGLYRGGPLQTNHKGYDRVLYLEADYMPMRSLSHLFVQDPESRLLTKGPNPEWEQVTDEQRARLGHELQRALDFAERCPGPRQQFWPMSRMPQRQLESDSDGNRSDGFIAMPMAYWIQQPCYMAGGPILMQPSRKLYELYAIPVTHCNTRLQPRFPDGPICDHDKKFRNICDETEMGYLNRIFLQNVTSYEGEPYGETLTGIGRTLHEFYTVLKNEFVFQPSPNQHMKGYYTRNYFKNDPSLTFANLFGVHYAGGDKPWKAEPHDLFGVPMQQYSDLLQLWEAHAQGKSTSIHLHVESNASAF